MFHYGSGNYEAFAHPRVPKDIEQKHAYIMGSGLAGLSAAFFLVRDAKMPGENIHILEKDPIPGGAMDGWQYPLLGYTMRGGREMDNHFEVMWDILRDVPSIENADYSVLDEYYWLNKDDPNYSLCRVTEHQGQDAHTDKKFTVSDKAQEQILKLYLTPEKDLENKTIEDVFDDEVLDSNFWLYWRTMFAFENWHSALEMKRYMQRFVHHIDGLPDLSALRFTRYNQYESMILPMVKYLEDHGVKFEYGVKLEDVQFVIREDEKLAQSITVKRDGKTETIPLTENDLLFLTVGGLVENSAFGSQTEPAKLDDNLSDDGGWSTWKKIAKQSDDFGHPEKFCGDVEKTNWESATVETLDEEIFPYIKAITGRDVLTGHVVTGGIVTAKDSSWLLSWTINRQPQFRNQPDGHALVWVYGLFTDREGDYVKKSMRDCTGEEICEEWLYHIGVPEDKIHDLAANHCNTIPCMMPFVTAFFMPRQKDDRPLVRPKGSKNFAFIGQFAETPRDTIFTTEYSMRTGMEAVYDLLDIERAVPEVWGSAYDVRDMLKAAVHMRDGKPLTEMEMNPIEKLAVKEMLKKVKGTDIELVLKEYGAIPEED
ncbi:oleate hydratase [Faecalibaculum rodentium]|jgi:oleate hydratase|uniref:oleate hydratase n=1 Tax=Faecalibaculum rodentium TaxID=1702221 RepID=UPI0023F432DC|nr:oleate hydratase [Faecalibaculum rodentium]